MGLAQAMHRTVAAEEGGGAGTVPWRGAENGRAIAPGDDAGGPEAGTGSAATAVASPTAKPHEPQKR
jgi:hypothetical protein